MTNIKHGVLLGILVCMVFIFPKTIHAQSENGSPQETFYKAKIINILNEGSETVNGKTYYDQQIQVKFLDGDMTGKQMVIDYGKGYSLEKEVLLSAGDTVVIVKTSGVSEPIYEIAEKYRLNAIIPIIIIFFVAIIILSGWQGVGSIVGMIMSLLIIVKYIIPQIISGADPLFVSIIGCLVIMITTIYLAHGFSKKTSIALLATFLTLVGTGLISLLFTHITSLTGLATEDTYSLKLGPTANINFKGLLLGGMLIGTLGVLDDVTTGLTASIFELSKANKNLQFKQLLNSGLTIGREHISSLVNTLVLAYAGASLPIFIFIALNPNNYPLWSILNSEMIIEEVVRTLTGSIGLVAAVPLTALLTSFYLSKSSKMN